MKSPDVHNAAIRKAQPLPHAQAKIPTGEEHGTRAFDQQDNVNTHGHYIVQKRIPTRPRQPFPGGFGQLSDASTGTVTRHVQRAQRR